MNLINRFKARISPKCSSVFSDRYLLCTNVCLSATLSALGDMIQQRYEILMLDSKKYNPIRTRNMTVCGITIGVFCHYWYIYLDRRLPGHAFRTVAKKVIVDQFVCSPVTISMLFLTSGVLENKTPGDLWKEMKKKAWILYAAEWTVWPPAQFISFYFLPTKYRVLYDNLVSLGYDVYTSHVKYSEENGDDNR